MTAVAPAPAPAPPTAVAADPRHRRKWWRTLRCLAAAGMVLAVAAYFVWPRHGLGRRVANTAVKLPLSAPGDVAWKTVNAFPQLKFFEPTCVAAARDGSNRLFVLERRGTIQVIQNDPEATSKQLFLDIFPEVMRQPYEDDGALGLILHPEFGQPASPNRGYFYVFYTARVKSQRFDRLSRFTVPDGQEVADPASEVVLIDQLDQDIWHNGGGMAFGADGFLYVGVGDEGGNEPDQFANGQRIDKNLFSGILRIDVNCTGGSVSHPPQRQPQTGHTAEYFIPNDNPFVGVPGALEEFWSIGLRNPHRISFDRGTDQVAGTLRVPSGRDGTRSVPITATGRLWVGDVGQQLREEVNIATRGSNHGWSYLEGSLPMRQSPLAGQKPSPLLGQETPPVHEYPHLNGDNCVIGGHVYRGKKLPELVGKYIYGDNGSGRIWALDYDGQKKVANTELTALPVSAKTGLSSVNEDADGELLLLVLGDSGREDGTLYRLVKAPPGESPLPKWLSQTGLFKDVRSLTPGPGVFAYTVNSPLWSDGAEKRRWIMLPGDGKDPEPLADHIEFTPTGNWTFPAGTVFVKHFELPADERDPTVVKRLETRLLVCQTDGGVYGVTYKWNDEGTDAELLRGGLREDVTITTAAGGTRTQPWQYPSRENCLVCHTKQANYVLGVNARQLNGDYHYPGTSVVTNQLREWSRIGMFTRRLDDEEIAGTPRLVAVGDASATLEHRARSYLDANCSQCHLPGGARANFDARFDTPLERQNLIDGPLATQVPVRGAAVVRPGDPFRSQLVARMLDPTSPTQPLSEPAKPMPALGVLRRDHQAIRVLTEWIDSLDVGHAARVPADGHASRVSHDLTDQSSRHAPRAVDGTRSVPATVTGQSP